MDSLFCVFPRLFRVLPRSVLRTDTHDLHALSTPPAFILSQDQTLKKISRILSKRQPCVRLKTTIAPLHRVNATQEQKKQISELISKFFELVQSSI